MGKTANRNISFFKNASRAVPILQRQIYNILRRSKQCNISYINIYIYSIYIYLYFKINVGNSIIDISHIQYVLRKRRIILLEKKKKKGREKEGPFPRERRNSHPSRRILVLPDLRFDCNDYI